MCASDQELLTHNFSYEEAQNWRIKMRHPLKSNFIITATNRKYFVGKYKICVFPYEHELVYMNLIMQPGLKTWSKTKNEKILKNVSFA